jgi:hypothetical protein
MYKFADAKKFLMSEGIWNDAFDFLYGIVKCVKGLSQQDPLLHELVFFRSVVRVNRSTNILRLLPVEVFSSTGC